MMRGRSLRIGRETPSPSGAPLTLIRPASPAPFSRREKGAPSALGLKLVAALGLAAGLAGCDPAGYPTCFRVECPYPPVYHASYANYIPAFVSSPPSVFGGDRPWDDPFADYTQRITTVSPSAGNAQAANLALQTATPWPRHSSNTNIPGNGARAVTAIHNLESGPKKTDDLGGGSGGGMGGGGLSGGH